MYVRLKRKKVIVTIIIEYVWICLNSECAWDPNYAKILNMAKFWIWHGSQYASVTQRSYAKMCLARVLNISWILYMPGFWIWHGSEYVSYTGFEICYNMAKYVWVCLNLP